MKPRAAEHKKIPSLPLTDHSGEIEAGPHPLSLSRQEKPFRWPSLSSRPEEELIAVLQLFAKALHAEIAPVLESIWSTAELLKDRRESGKLENRLMREVPGTRIDAYNRLCYISQQAVMAWKILEKLQHFSSLKTKTVLGIEMFDLKDIHQSSSDQAQDL